MRMGMATAGEVSRESGARSGVTQRARPVAVPRPHPVAEARTTPSCPRQPQPWGAISCSVSQLLCRPWRQTKTERRRRRPHLAASASSLPPHAAQRLPSRCPQRCSGGGVRHRLPSAVLSVAKVRTTLSPPNDNDHGARPRVNPPVVAAGRGRRLFVRGGSVPGRGCRARGSRPRLRHGTRLPDGNGAHRDSRQPSTWFCPQRRSTPRRSRGGPDEASGKTCPMAVLAAFPPRRHHPRPPVASSAAAALRFPTAAMWPRPQRRGHVHHDILQGCLRDLVRGGDAPLSLSAEAATPSVIPWPHPRGPPLRRSLICDDTPLGRPRGLVREMTSPLGARVPAHTSSAQTVDATASVTGDG